MDSTGLPGAVRSAALSTQQRTVYKIATVPCSPGDVLRLTFDSVDQRWRHGVWLGVEGRLLVAGTESPQILLWEDTAAPTPEIAVLETSDGLLHLYNVWESGPAKHRQSQSHTSGMLREELPGGWRFRCNDVGTEPDFSALVFTLLHA